MGILGGLPPVRPRAQIRTLLTATAFISVLGAQASTYADVIFSSPEPSKPTINIENADWLTALMGMPAFWGIEITGADLAKDDIASLNLKPVVAVVSDGQIKNGATRVLDAHVPKRVHRMIDLQLLAHMGLKIFAPSLERRPGVRSILKQLPKIPHPSDMMVNPAHPTHGEHVAGTIGAENQAYGVSSVAEIESLDVFQGESPARAEVLEASYDYLLARKEPTPVLNMSHGIGDEPEILNDIRRLARERDTLCVIASNNQGVRIPDEFPLGQLPECVVVGAFGLTGTRAYFSNFGSMVKIVAPGEQIFSRGIGVPYKSDQIEIMSGTSMATPMVSGAFTILRALLPEARSEDLKTILYTTAIDLGKPGRDDFTGHGLLNVVKAESVARRLREKEITSAADIHKAVLDPQTFELGDEYLKLRLERLKAETSGQKADDRLYRKELLLEGSPKALYDLAKTYEEKGQLVFSVGLQYAAANRPQSFLDKTELEKLGAMMIAMQSMRLEQSHEDWAIIQSLANKDILLSMYNHLGPQTATLLTPEFQKILAGIDPTAESELVALFDQKTDELSKLALGGSSKTAP